MFFELIEDIVTTSLIVAALCFGIITYVRNWRPSWSEPLAKGRITILLGLALAVLAVKIGEDVLFEESGAIDEAILLTIHRYVSDMPAVVADFFALITFSGSLKFLLPLTTTVTLLLLIAKHRAEALLIGASVLSSALIVYVVKAAVQRDRPLLWQTE